MQGKEEKNEKMEFHFHGKGWGRCFFEFSFSAEKFLPKGFRTLETKKLHEKSKIHFRIFLIFWGGGVD